MEFYNPVIILNFKTYEKGSKASALKLAELCTSVSKKFKVKVILAIQACDIYRISKAVKLPIYAQHVDAIEYARTRTNLYFETSDASFLIIKEALEQLGSERIIFGSEFPMYHVVASLENVLNQKCNDIALENILCNNILRLLNINK